MKKRIFSLILALALLCALLPQAALTASAEVYSGSCGDNLTWSLDTETGLLTITGSGAMTDYDNWNDRAPWYDYREAITAFSLPEGLTSIGDSAFKDCRSLTSVTIPDSVTSIGKSAFYYCSALTGVTIPNSVTSIGESVFSGCSSLTSVTIGNSVTSIGDYAFWLCSALTSVTIPNSVTSIGERAFSKCSALTGVTIPDSVTSIRDFAFFDCSALTSVTIPNSVTSIGEDAFSFCSALTAINVAADNPNYSSDNGVLFNKAQTELIQYPAGKPDASYQIPASVTSIGARAFYYCSALTSVTIPDSVTSIGYSAFDGCSALTSVTIPNGVTSIGDWAFCRCSALTGVTIGNGVTSIGDWAFFACSSLTSVTIPTGVTSIGAGAFEGCSSLTSVTIGNGVTDIGEYAFLDCSALTGVTVPASVTSIGDQAFGYYYDKGYQKIDGFTISGYPGTAAETYATENEFAFVALEGFSDVAQSDYFFNPVMWATTHEPPITAGVAPGLFGPHNPCTREQIVTFLWAANGKPAPAGTGSTFSDVPADAWYYKPVMWAVENKITSGLPDGSFGVGQPCTRAQAMTFLWAAQGKPAPSSMESPFSDVSSGDWFCKAILWAAENGITKGVGDGLFGVNNTCTRAQIITFLYKAYN